jgi:hypothetical protein
LPKSITEIDDSEGDDIESETDSVHSSRSRITLTEDYEGDNIESETSDPTTENASESDFEVDNDDLRGLKNARLRPLPQSRKVR